MAQTVLNVHRSGMLRARLVVEDGQPLRLQGDESLIDLHATPQGLSVEDNPHAWAQAMASLIEGASLQAPEAQPAPAERPELPSANRLEDATRRAKARMQREQQLRRAQLTSRTSLMGPRRPLTLLQRSAKSASASGELPGRDERLPWQWPLLGALLGLVGVVGARLVGASAGVQLLAAAALAGLFSWEKLKALPREKRLLGLLAGLVLSLALAWLATRTEMGRGLLERLPSR